MNEKISTRFYKVSENIIRCVALLSAAEDSGFAAASYEAPVAICIKNDEELIPAAIDKEQVYKCEKLSARVLADGGIKWCDGTGKILLTEKVKELEKIPLIEYTTEGEAPVIERVKTVDGERNFVKNLRPAAAGETLRAALNFEFDDNEAIHGLGQGEDGIFNLRYHTHYMYQHNMRIPIPFFISEKGYGVFVNCGSLMIFTEGDKRASLICESVDRLDYYVIQGDSADEIIDGYRRLTGKAVMLPKWSFGYVQSKERYCNQEELVAVAKEYRRLDIPIDCVVQDWKTWKGDEWGCKRLDRERYPDLKAATDELKRLNVHSMVSVWPNINSGTEDYEEMDKAGYLLNDLATYDAFNEEARKLYWQQAERDLFAGGFDSWWCDSTEPFSGPDWGGENKRDEKERYELVGGEHNKFLGPKRANLYAVAHAKGIYENQIKSNPKKRVLNLTRSGYSSIQKYGTMLWSGDITAKWDTLKKQIAEGLNMASSGMPYWTLDIGGFFVLCKNWQKRGCECNNDPAMKWFWQGDYESGIEDMGYRELYVRWLQMGVFLPMFRSHGTDAPREIWNFGNKGDAFYDAIAEAIRLRYRLMPYIYSLAGDVWLNNGTIMRPLFFDFPGDSKACACDTEYMFGKNLLICPVIRPMYYEAGSAKMPQDTDRSVECYLPAGTKWTDYYSGKVYEGGRNITLTVSLDNIPVFVRAGSIIPMEAKLDYAGQQVGTPLEIHIYPGADGEFTYYEDAGDDYEYETGNYNTVNMRWDDGRKELCLDACRQKTGYGIIGRRIKVTIGDYAAESVYNGESMIIKC